MTDLPEFLDTLPKRMRYAATILEETSRRHGCHPDETWRATDLRREADLVEDEDTENAEREALVEKLARDLSDTSNLGEGFNHKRRARELIERGGWRKQ